MDTSALVKYVLPAEYDDNLERVVLLHRKSEIQLIAPNFLLVECANVLWKNALRTGEAFENVISTLNDLRRTNIRLVPQEYFLEDALRIALNMEVTVYDALYCALARRENAELITEDRRLRNALENTDIRCLTLRMWAE
ncbi:MAG: type II toxin-antitoxin system VapC family toxin [Dehalococcoidia bacterium]|nr:type II toxin-antitoxin system VapC family toxin [Dehalococcoidia bacterium]